jgi:hypothetical protein
MCKIIIGRHFCAYLSGRPNWIVTKVLANQLQQIRVCPPVMRFVGITNSHIDHIGNLGLLPTVTLLPQKSEWEFAQRRPSVEGIAR